MTSGRGAIEVSGREAASQERHQPVIRFVDRVLERAVERRASDVHFEAFRDSFRIRYRIDGRLCELPSPPHHLVLPVVARIKVMADLDISECRTPQDGRLRMVAEGRKVDLRVSTLPTRYGESVVLRVLDRSTMPTSLEGISMPADTLLSYRRKVALPHGLLVVTGPTGSGKTTTLYSTLQEKNGAGVKIMSAEDPVEYEVDGIMQVAVTSETSCGFSDILRSFLRHDPDVIMVGEIRDDETARLAVQAALTGHLVMTTLHTNDAAGAVTRLLDLGVEQYLLSASLEGVLAQRLLRRIDPELREVYIPSEEILRRIGWPAGVTPEQGFFRGIPGPENDHTGYRGRVALFEWLSIGDDIRTAINQNSSDHVIRGLGIESGMRTLREEGVRAVLGGLTSIEEVLQET